jgi:hypothetical protein
VPSTEYFWHHASCLISSISNASNKIIYSTQIELRKLIPFSSMISCNRREGERIHSEMGDHKYADTMFPLSRYTTYSRNSHARRRVKTPKNHRIKMTRTLSMHMLAILLLSNAAFASGSIHVDTAFTTPIVQSKRPSAISTTTTGTTIHQYAPQTSLLRGRSRLPCFHFMEERSPDKKEHYNDALLNRIINGRTSDSPRWRKRTKRAAASLGIQRQHRTEQDYIHEQEQIYQNSRTDRPIVPPPSSTIFRATDNNVEAKLRRGPSSLSFVANNKNKLQITTFSKKKKKLTQEQHAQAKLEWAAKYTSIHNLRRTFGRNRNKIWGDFDTKITRKLYHTLLPRALLGLYEADLFCPTDLAPLAFEARVAAKKYARERCVLPGRVAAMAYDGFRSWRTWGTWSVEGMSWEQIWNKYETQILEEYMEDHSHVDLDDLQEEITAQICLRILERSCITNEAVDKMFLEGSERKKRGKRNSERDLARIKVKLEKDMEEIAETDRQLRVMNEWSNKSPFFLADVIGDVLPASLPVPSLF